MCYSIIKAYTAVTRLFYKTVTIGQVWSNPIPDVIRGFLHCHQAIKITNVAGQPFDFLWTLSQKSITGHISSRYNFLYWDYIHLKVPRNIKTSCLTPLPIFYHSFMYVLTNFFIDVHFLFVAILIPILLLHLWYQYFCSSIYLYFKPLQSSFLKNLQSYH